MTAPLLIALPDGLSVSGVTTWAVRLAGELASRGRACGLIVHGEPEGAARLGAGVHPDVRVYDARGLGRFGETADLGPIIELYGVAVDDLRARAGGPVVVSPNLRGDCYGVAAALVERGADVRLVGWQHSDIEYDRRVLAHFAPAIERFVGVSGRIVEELAGVLGDRAGDVVGVPYGVPTPAAPVARKPVSGRPLRLIYTGRMEHRQKRILSLVHLSDALTRRGIAHELVLLGDGPAAAEVDALCATRTGVRRVEPVGPGEVASMLDAADVFVLGSRFEGLSVSMLEAMARGCVPVVARVESGAAEAIEDGVNGCIADVGTDAAEETVGEALADAVERLLALGVAERSRAAWSTVSTRFSLALHAERVESMLHDVARAPRRAWPAGRLLAFDSAGGSVGPDGAARLGAVLSSLSGRRIVVHGAGAHTRVLWSVLEGSGVEVAALADDDRAMHGSTVGGVPVVAPGDAADVGATDVVISSWMHEDAIWARRAVYERQGLRVHRIYAGDSRAYERDHAACRSATA